jgi:branched-chain amino acid transport system ATP-binding protein
VTAVTPPILACFRLTAGYHAVPVIHDIDLSINPGEVVALLGPNGAGKTTTILALAGELPAMGGEVHISGEASRAPLHRRARAGVALVPEERSIFRGLSCHDNLRVGLGDPEAAYEVFPDLRKRARLRAGLLSGGEQQMLALGRALSMKPRLLLADELSLGLAPLIVARLLAAVRTAADNGCGVLLVEQHISQALEIADTAHVIRRGRIEMSGSAIEMKARLDEIERSYLSGTRANPTN